MDEDAIKSLTRSICLRYLTEKLSETQNLLRRLRFCKCPEFGGKRCGCTIELEASPRSPRFSVPGKINTLKDAETQSDDTVGLSGVRDAPDNSMADKYVPFRNTAANSRGNAFSVAKQQSFVEQAYEGLSNPYVLIINNVNFWKFPQPRTGAQYDLDNLRKFLAEAGFKNPVEHFDLPKRELLSILEITRQDGALVDYDGLICIIMSHGSKEGILGVDGESIPVDNITAKFQGDSCPQLSTKPKLFFLQACRGDIDDKGYFVPRGPIISKGDISPDSEETFEEMPVKLPSEADFLIAYSTTKGHTAYKRYTDSIKYATEHSASLGSWFISCMVQIFRANSHQEDLMTMLTKVNKAMCELYTGASPSSGCKQISCQLSMLTKKVYFVNYMSKLQNGLQQ